MLSTKMIIILNLKNKDNKSLNDKKIFNVWIILTFLKFINLKKFINKK